MAIDRRTLAAREHDNMIVAWERIGSVVPGSLVRREGGIALIATGLPARFFNQVLVEREDASEAALEAAIEAVRARGDPFLVHLRAGIDRHFISTLERLGLEPHEDGDPLPGMALHPVPSLPLAPGPGHEIRRVASPGELEDNLQVTLVGFEMPESIGRAIVQPALVDRPGIAFYTGYTHGVPVSSGLGVRSGDTIGIYNIATIPSHRRHGYGAAMTSRIAADGAAAGCDVAILQASEMGRSTYERLGYETVVEYRGYVDPEPAAEPGSEPASPGADPARPAD